MTALYQENPPCRLQARAHFGIDHGFPAVGTWSDTRGMAVKADIKPVTGGEYDFTVNFRRGKDPIVTENAKTVRLTEPNTGIVVFEKEEVFI